MQFNAQNILMQTPAILITEKRYFFWTFRDWLFLTPASRLPNDFRDQLLCLVSSSFQPKLQPVWPQTTHPAAPIVHLRESQDAWWATWRQNHWMFLPLFAHPCAYGELLKCWLGEEKLCHMDSFTPQVVFPLCSLKASLVLLTENISVLALQRTWTRQWGGSGTWCRQQWSLWR